MSKISEDLFKDIKEVLKKQFNIEIIEVAGKYRFVDLTTESTYEHANSIIFYKNSKLKGEERHYHTPNGKHLKYIEEAYPSGLGNITIVFEHDGAIWSIEGNNNPRTKKTCCDKVNPDCPHVTIKYHGKKCHHNYVDADYNVYITRSTEIIIQDSKSSNNSFCSSNLLATIVLLNSTIAYITFNGIYLRDLNRHHDSLISSSYNPDLLRSLINEQLDIDYFISMGYSKETIMKLISFLSDRIDKFANYMHLHQDEVLERLDEMVRDSNSRKEEVLSRANMYIEHAHSTNNKELKRVEEYRKVFVKDFLKKEDD